MDRLHIENQLISKPDEFVGWSDVLKQLCLHHAILSMSSKLFHDHFKMCQLRQNTSSCFDQQTDNAVEYNRFNTSQVAVGQSSKFVNWLIDQPTNNIPRSQGTMKTNENMSFYLPKTSKVCSSAFVHHHCIKPEVVSTGWTPSLSLYSDALQSNVGEVESFIDVCNLPTPPLPSSLSSLSPPPSSDVINFRCSVCSKQYATVGAARLHARTHTLPCQCPACGKAFSRPWLLRGHWRTHTGERPFQCPDPSCRRAFADRSNLRAHLQTHASVKKYGCGSCSKTFSRVSLVVKHRKTCLATDDRLLLQ